MHCFEYGRGKQDELEKYCEEVFYYKRNTGLKGFSPGLPYIVSSRINGQLLAKLLKDNYPVLLEGIHCTYYLYINKLINRKVFVRLHNVEFKYYHQLANAEISFLKKMYFLRESRLLKKYEEKISAKATFITVALSDKEVYENDFNAGAIKYLPAFLPYTLINVKEGTGNYCLYHGNLAVAENEKAATWLIENVFADLKIPLLIAGKNPSKKLVGVIKQFTNVNLSANPEEEEMNKLISEAQINILPSFNSTGIKIKLLNALFNGRHCLVNKAAVAGTGLTAVCHIAEDNASFKQHISELFDRTICHEEVVLRKQLLLPIYNNVQNARQLIEWIY